VFIATGDSGMGMTHGTIAGILLPELINGREHPWLEVYDPSRKPVLGLKGLRHGKRECRRSICRLAEGWGRQLRR
jgi:glycine/D-amino acid oxidase-like deaminating enzyme